MDETTSKYAYAKYVYVLVRMMQRASFTPGHPHKRFIRDLGAQAELPEPVITVRQAEHLARLAHRYRRQVPRAEKMLASAGEDCQ